MRFLFLGLIVAVAVLVFVSVVGFPGLTGPQQQEQAASILVLTKQGSAQSLTSYRFSSTDTTQDVANADIAIKNPSGDQQTPWTIVSDVPWLSVTPDVGIGPNVFTVSADRSLLASGGQSGHIIVAINGVKDSVVTIYADCSNAVKNSRRCGLLSPTPTPALPPSGTVTPPGTPTPSPTPNPSPSPTPNPSPSPSPNPQSNGATTFAPYPPIRPSYQDVSIKEDPSFKHTKSSAFKWFRGITSSQTYRDAMQQALMAIYVPEAIRYARTMPSCVANVNSALSANLNPVMARLMLSYEWRGLQPANGIWGVQEQGRHYSFGTYALQKVQACSLTSSAATACATNPLMTKDLLDLLDMRIEDGKCVKGATFTVPQPTEEFNKYRAQDGVVSRKAVLRPLTDQQMKLLHATHEAHVAVSNWRCGTGPQPAAGIVGKAHIALEATAVDETQHHFLRMKDFSGAVDVGWTKDEACSIARLQDKAHQQWMDAVMTLDWFKTRIADNDHQMEHVCMGLKDERLTVRPFCDAKHINDCPVISCQQLIQQQQPAGERPL